MSNEPTHEVLIKVCRDEVFPVYEMDLVDPEIDGEPTEAELSYTHTCYTRVTPDEMAELSRMQAYAHAYQRALNQLFLGSFDLDQIRADLSGADQ